MRSLCMVVIATVTVTAVPPAVNEAVQASAMDAEIRTFLGRELAAHLAPITSLDPPPERVNGALTTGEYTWGTFMRALAAYAQMSKATTLGTRDLPRTIGDIGLLEVRLKGTRFSQLYAALSLRHYGTDLSTNRLWQALTPSERDAWMTLLDANRFYDPAKREVINLPENYLGVAARIAAMAWDVGLLKDRVALDSLLDRAAIQFTSGALYADDALPTGRYDRYSNEYVRYVWEAAEIAGRKDLLASLSGSIRQQMRLWWDLVSDDGYGYPWGRSLGIVSYLDTLEIAGFLALHPEFRPAPLDQLAAAYHAAWRYLRKDYKDDRHLLSLYDFGRGNFAYISIDREFQQTAGFLGKLAHAHMQLTAGLAKERVAQFPPAPALAPVARFEAFRTSGRHAGVWLVRQGKTRFALPITTGTRPGVADYLPAPHGLPGFAAPVEQIVPALVPFVELSSGETIVAADGADAIEPSPDGRGVTARWTRWARIGSKSTEWIEPGLTTVVEWRLDGTAIVRTERITASKPVRMARWRVVLPSTASSLTTQANASRVDTLSGREGTLRIAVETSPWPLTVSARSAAGDTPLGRGARGAIPLHLEYEARDVTLAPGTPVTWTLRLEVR